MTRHRIGIDLGGTKIEIAVLAPDGSERHRHRIDTPHGYQASLEGIASLVREAEAQLGVTATVGIGIPGVISPATGLVKNANSIALNGHAFDRDISALLGREVRVENDANCFALSEATRWRRRRPGHGVRRDPRHRLRRRRGDRRQGAARPQPRHRRMGPQPAALAAAGRNPGPQCWCGHSGCLETWIAGPSLARDCDGEGAHDASGIPARAAAGEARAQAALDRHADRLARGLAPRDQPARPRRDRAGRRAVQHGAPLHRAAAAGHRLRVQRLRAARRSCATGMAIRPACAARHGCGRLGDSRGAGMPMAASASWTSSMCAATVMPASATVCPSPRSQVPGVRRRPHRRPSRTVRADHRPHRLRRLLRQRREARPPGTCCASPSSSAAACAEWSPPPATSRGSTACAAPCRCSRR